MRKRLSNLVETIVSAAEEKKARDILVLDIRKLAGVTDYLVIMSGESAPQLKAIISEIEQRVKKEGIKGRSWEGAVNSGWLILDLLDIVVHVMSEEERAYYDLEGIWGKEAIVYHV